MNEENEKHAEFAARQTEQIAELTEKAEYLNNENEGLAERVTQQQNRAEQFETERDQARDDCQVERT